MPDTTEEFTALVRLVSTVTDVPEEALGGDSRFEEMGEWNSLAALRLLTAVEDRFQVRLNLRQYFQIKTVDGLAAMITASPSGQPS